MSQIFKVRAIPRAKKNFIKEEGALLKVYLTAPAREGAANKALLKLLAKHLKVKKSQLRIKQGEKSRDKLISLED